MMAVSPGTLVVVGIAVAILLWTGRWTDQRYRRFDQLPVHYDFRGRPTRMAPRRTMAWLLPIVFSVMLSVIAVGAAILPREMQNNPDFGLVFASVTLVAAQGFVLWLLARWARKQSSET